MENTNKCTIVFDGNVHESEDFIAVVHKPDGTASILFQTDALSVGLGIKALAVEFVNMMKNCTEEEKGEIQEILGEAFFVDGVLPNA